jgi:HAD superfamily hydrolase (TIGR01509 family)
MIRAVIFDFNGVLLDDEHVHFELFREVLAGQGVDLSAEQYHTQFLGFDDRRCFEEVFLAQGRAATAEQLDAFVAQKAVRYVEVAEAGLRFFPGAGECLSLLAQSYTLAINSGALRNEIELALRRLKCRERVAVIVSAEDATLCKPDPQGYLLALEGLRRLDRPACTNLDASECLVIEDSLAGIESAKGAGMHVAGIPHTYKPEQLLAVGADVVLPDLATLTPDWIRRNFNRERTDGRQQ